MLISGGRRFGGERLGERPAPGRLRAGLARHQHRGRLQPGLRRPPDDALGQRRRGHDHAGAGGRELTPDLGRRRRRVHRRRRRARPDDPVEGRQVVGAVRQVDRHGVPRADTPGREPRREGVHVALHLAERATHPGRLVEHGDLRGVRVGESFPEEFVEADVGDVDVGQGASVLHGFLLEAGRAHTLAGPPGRALVAPPPSG